MRNELGELPGLTLSGLRDRWPHSAALVSSSESQRHGSLAAVRSHQQTCAQAGPLNNPWAKGEDYGRVYGPIMLFGERKSVRSDRQ